MTFATELMARIYYLWMLLVYTGIQEKTTWHLEILAQYNKITPLPRQHKAAKSDSWCAIFVNAIAWTMGYRKWPWECSCTNIRAEAKRRGIWRDGWSAMPQLGDWVIYDWGNNGTMDHIGAVCFVLGNSVWVVEGNYDDAVKIRRITVGDIRVEGSVALDFSELVDSPVENVDALRPGDKGECVRQLQGVLRLSGYYDGNLDGSYGPQTTQAVTEFQAANDLEPDGKCGPKTQAVLRSFDFKVKEGREMVEKRYQRIDEMPEWARATIAKLEAHGWLKGDENGNLNLSEDMIREFVVNDRAGLYD